MNKQKDNRPFRQWVPRPLGIAILLLMFVPPTFSGGAYLSNIGEMTGGLGVWTEDVQMASFFTSIGMCLFPPFMVRFLQARRIKQTYLWCFFLLALLNVVCATATSRPVLFVGCMLTGFVRIMTMLNCTFTIAPYLTGMDTLAMFTMTEEPPAEVQYQLERKRTFLMPVLYFFILLISQMSNVLTAWFAYHYHWQDAYYAVVAMLLVAMLLVVLTMADEQPKPYAVEWRKVPGMILMAVALCCMTYVLVYGKTLDWMSDNSIHWALVVLLISCGLLLMNVATTGNEGYLPLGTFRYRNVGMSMLLFLLTMIFNSASSLFASYARLATPINNMQSASLSLWAAVGCMAGLVVSLVMIVRRAHFRTVFCVAFLLMATANTYVYFQYQTAGLFSNMILPTMLNFTGLLILYSVVAAWGMKRLPSRYLATYVFLMIWMRNGIAPVVGSSIYSNAIYRQQQYNTVLLSQNVDSENPLAATAFAQTKRMAQLSGKSCTEAEQLATTSMKGRVAVQSAIVTMKGVTGQTVVLLLGAALLTLVLPYKKNETT